MHIASDQNLRARCARRLLLKDRQHAMCCCAGNDFERAGFSQLTNDREQIAFPFIDEEATSF
jgi:hypothetical protein